VSRWLVGEGFPAARVLDGLEQPLIVDDHPVTFVLRELHAPPYAVFGRTALRVEK
jgi:hypothetical protein